MQSQPQWTEGYANLPLHIYERIFSRLSATDKIAASYVCKQWEEVIFGSELLRHDLAMSVVRYDDDGKVQLIDREVLESSTRVLPNIVFIPDMNWRRFDWKDVTAAVKKLNDRCHFRSARVEGSQKTNLNVPRAIHLFGAHLPDVQHLELKIDLSSVSDTTWLTVFQTFSNLISLTLYHGHGRALASAQTYCRKLVSLKLVKYAFTSHLANVLSFPKLEELIIDEMDVPAKLQSYQWGYGEVFLPKLKHLTLQITDHSHMLELIRPPSNLRLLFLTPSLETLVATDLARHFAIVLEASRLENLTLTYDTSVARVLTAPIRFFASLRLTHLRQLTIQGDNAWSLVPKLLTFARTNCPNLLELVIEQRISEHKYELIKDFAKLKIKQDLTVLMKDEARPDRQWSLTRGNRIRSVELCDGGELCTE